MKNKCDLSIHGAFTFENMIYPDSRGSFREWYRTDYSELSSFHPEQINISTSRKGTLRGMHFSIAPSGQSKVVTAAAGSFLDVIIDVRVGSPTHLAVEQVTLSNENAKSLYIPSGVAHGVLALEDNSVLVYLLSSNYDPTSEFEINAFDPFLGINWPGGEFELSDKDREARDYSENKLRNTLPTYRLNS